jgi:hypothetical protein
MKNRILNLFLFTAACYYLPVITPAHAQTGTSVITPSNNIESKHALYSAIFAGVNIGSSAVNLANINNHEVSELGSVTGLVSGGASFFLGLHYLYHGNNTNEAEKHLSMVNIGLGTVSIICALGKLATPLPAKEKSVTWNVRGLPSLNNQMGIGLNMMKRF